MVVLIPASDSFSFELIELFSVTLKGEPMGAAKNSACTAVARGTHGFHHLRVHRKTQRRTCVTRNAMVSTIVPNRDTRDNRIRRCVNALLKFRFDVADAVKLAVLIPKEIELQLLALLDALQVFDVLGEDG